MFWSCASPLPGFCRLKDNDGFTATGTRRASHHCCIYDRTTQKWIVSVRLSNTMANKPRQEIVSNSLRKLGQESRMILLLQGIYIKESNDQPMKLYQHFLGPCIPVE